MGNRKTEHSEHTHSVADEAYRGPSLGVTAVGYNAVQWKIGLLVGGAIGFAGALLFPSRLNAGVTALERWIKPRIAVGQTSRIMVGKTDVLSNAELAKLKLEISEPTAGNWFTRGIAQFTNWSLRQSDHAGHWMVERFNGASSRVGSNIKIEKEGEIAQQGMLGFGIGGLLGMIGSMFTSSAQAYYINKRAHNQFHRAQHEIKDLQAENAALRSRSADIEAKCDTKVTPTPAAPTIMVPDEPKPEPAASEKPTSIIQKELALAPESRLIASQQLAAL